MAVSEILTLIDKVTAPAQRMTAAMSGLEKVTKRVQSQLAKIGGKRELKGIEQPLRAGGKALSDWDRMVKKATADMGREHKVAALAARETRNMGGAAKGATGAVKRLGAKDALGAFGVGGAIGSGIFTAVLALGSMISVVRGAISSAIDLASAFGEGVIQATLLREKALALSNTLSGGKGPEVLNLIKQQAIKTGQSFEELQVSTFKARDAGLSFREAFKLNLVRADIIASGRSAKEADAAIGDMLAEVKGGKAASAATAELAARFGVVGDGAAAAARATNTFAGVWERLKAAPANLLDRAAEKFSARLNGLAPGTSKFLDRIAADGGPADKVIDALLDGFELLIEVGKIAAELFPPFLEGLKIGFSPLIALVDAIGKALKQAFGADRAETMATLSSIVKGLGVAIGVAVGAATGMLAVFGLIVGALALPIVLFGTLIAKIAEIAPAAYNAGKNLIDGLVNGIRDGIGRAVAVARDLANAVKNTVSNVLGIHSDSKVFERLGDNIVGGFAKSIESGAGDAAGAGRRLAVAPVGGAASGAGGAARGAAGGVTLNVNVSALPGATKEDGERLASGLVPIIRREVASFFEGSMLEAGA